MATLQLINLTKTYHRSARPALDHVSLSIEDHELVVLIGPSGCGKSTLLRMIAGLEEATEGDLLKDGVRINELDPKDRGMAMVFQDYALYPHMTVYDNLAFNLKIARVSRTEIDERVRETAGILQLIDLLDRKPHQLSGGQKQRVALGRALTRRPDIYLMDEPLSNLDAQLRMNMRVEIAKLHQQLNATMIYVTHDQVEAMTMADKIVVMNEGKVLQVDTPNKVYHEPVNLFVAQFLGGIPLNVLSASQMTIFSDITEEILEEILRKNIVDDSSGGGSCHKYNGQLGLDNILFGIRPENLVINKGGSAKVTLQENYGNEQVVHVEHEAVAVKVRGPGLRNYQRGDRVAVSIDDLDHVMLFDKESHERISHTV